MKQLKFQPHLVKQIIEGTKTATWRLFDDKDLRVGDKLELLNWESNEKFAEADIVRVEEKKLGQVEESDFDGHEKYVSPEVMLQEFRKYYGDRVTMETVVKMIGFKIS